jgi:hypothetical protein
VLILFVTSAIQLKVGKESIEVWVRTVHGADSGQPDGEQRFLVVHPLQFGPSILFVQENMNVTM